MGVWDSWDADIGDAVFEGPLRAGDCRGVSNSNSGFDVMVGGIEGTIGGVGVAATCAVSKAAKSQIWAAGADGSAGAGTASTSLTVWPCWSFDDTASSVTLVSAVGAGEVRLSADSEASALAMPTSKNPLTGRLALGGETTISPHSSSLSSSSSTSGTGSIDFSGDTEGGADGGASCKEVRLSGSLMLVATDLLLAKFTEVTSMDRLTARLGGREEPGVSEAEPSVAVLHPKAGLLGGPGILRGEGEGGGRLLTPGDGGGRLLTPVDRFREWA